MVDLASSSLSSTKAARRFEMERFRIARLAGAQLARELFFFVPVLMKRHKHSAHVKLRAYICAAAWLMCCASLLLHLLVGVVYGWLAVCSFQLFFVIAGSAQVFWFMEFRDKTMDASDVERYVNPLLEISLGCHATQMLQAICLGATWTAVLFILPGLAFDVYRRRRLEYYVDVTTLWKALGPLDDASKVRLALDSVLFVWLLALMFIQLLQRLLT